MSSIGLRAALIAVDAGGTSTRAALVDLDGRVLGTGRAGGGNPTSRGAEGAGAAVAAAARQALGEAPPRVGSVLVAHAGERLPAYYAAIAEGLAAHGVQAPIRQAGDLEALYASGTSEPDGAALIAGTGAIGGAVAGGRVVEVVDGTGWLLGDAGSGFWIGHRVARAAVDDLDGGPATALTRPLLAALGIDEDRGDDEGRAGALREVVSRLYAERPVDLARFAPLAFTHRDDPVARRILVRAVDALAALVACIRAAQPAGPLVVGGSVLVQGLLRLPDGLADPLLRLAGAALPVADGLVGAAVLALRSAGTPVGPTLHAALVRDLGTPLPPVPAAAAPLPVEVRAPRPSDTAAVYRICFETGPDPEDPGRTPELLGHVWAGPYLAFAPHWCRVLVDARGVAGYLLAVPSSAAYERWAAEEWWPPLRLEHPADAPGLSPADRAVAELFATPPASPPDLVATHPAHLHIDLLQRARGRGFARLLIDDLCDRLAAEGVPGVHLGVAPDNARATAVYRRLGFEVLRHEPDVVWMGRRL
ncbi:GNAT family N-acetyltransferase [Amnibacterium endophyticum]|uniref:GNAT family N-acetyltransferase n=1 Tax=Amnibacterium endophyticum TaxID=2109337 RepID=A0ABW4LFY2_9MICO